MDLDRHSAFLHALAKRLVRDAQEAEDVVQEAYVAALERPPRRTGNLRVWLAGVVRNLAHGRLRSRARRRRRERAVARPEAVPAVDDAGHKELLALLARAVEHLPEPERATVWARYLEGKSASEIAARDGVTPKTVRVRLRKARARLRDRLGPTTLALLAALGGRPRAAAALLLPAALVVLVAAGGIAIVIGRADAPPAVPRAVVAETVTPEPEEPAPTPTPRSPLARAPTAAVPPAADPAPDPDPPAAPGPTATDAAWPPPLVRPPNEPQESLPTWGYMPDWGPRREVWSPDRTHQVVAVRRGRSESIDVELRDARGTVARGVVHQLPLHLRVLDARPGFVIVERYFNPGFGWSVALVDATARYRWALRLADLFPAELAKKWGGAGRHSIEWLAGFWCDETRERFLVRTRTDEFREIGLRDGRVEEVGAAALVPYARAGPAAERIAAIAALRELRPEGACAACNAVAADPSAPLVVRLHAHVAAVALGAAEVSRALLERGLADPGTRDFAYAHLPDLDRLLLALRGPDGARARAGLAALGTEALPALRRLVADRTEAPAARLHALWAWAKIGTPDAPEPALLRAGFESGDAALYPVCDALLAGLGPAATPAMTDLLDGKDASEDARTWALNVLWRTADPTAADVLYRTLDGNDPRLGPLALLALQKIRPAGLDARLQRLLVRGTTFDRSLAGHFARHPDATATEALLRALERHEKDRPLRDGIIQALFRCTGEHHGYTAAGWRRGLGLD